MAGYYGAEVATQLIEAQIKATIATTLANVRTERNDPIVTTEIPKEYFIYPDAHCYRLPAIFTIFEGQKILNPESDGNHINAVDDVVVVVVLEDRLESLLTKKAWRYQAALMQSLHLVTLTNSDGGLRLFLKVDSCEFSATVNLVGDRARNAMFRKEMGIRLSVDHIENLQ
jgi:hypothetical protein